MQYYLFPQLTVTVSADRFVNVSDISSHYVTVTTNYGLGVYELDLAAVATSAAQWNIENTDDVIQVAEGGFIWVFETLTATLNAATGSSVTVTATPADHTSIINAYTIALSS